MVIIRAMAIYKAGLSSILKDSHIDFVQLTTMFVEALEKCEFNVYRKEFIFDLFLSLNNPDISTKVLARKYSVSLGSIAHSRSRVLASLARLPLKNGVSFEQLMPGAKLDGES